MDLLREAEPTKPIDLLCGWPNSALLPTRNLLRSATAVLTDSTITHQALQYGPDEGYKPLRCNIARWLGNLYKVQGDISPQRICITGGASQNLACILQVFTDPVYTRNVWMVEPTYHLAGRIIEDAGFAGRIRGVPEDEGGIDLGFLERELRVAEDKAESEDNTQPVCCYSIDPVHILIIIIVPRSTVPVLSSGTLDFSNCSHFSEIQASSTMA